MQFSELADAYMRQWLAGTNSRKQTNTEQQKRATFRLFEGFWDNKPIRAVRQQDAAAFRDKLKLFDPNWARAPLARKMSWKQLVLTFGDRPRGLSDATMNRHMRALQSLWDWARRRGHCDGDNPFEGFHRKLRPGVNVDPYVKWEAAELQKLLNPPPKRSDVLEVIIVGLFSGMRLDEIASLTWGRLRTAEEDGQSITYFRVDDAKTAAGIRDVPVHPALGWLLQRPRGADDDRIWPNFNEEGVGKKPGADASREFSRFKASRGFTSRRKSFHSFRKNVTHIMERAQVLENEWAQVFGHERGFTYSVYNPDGISLARKAEIIRIINYPAVAIPHPTSRPTD
jgi:integrase